MAGYVYRGSEPEPKAKAVPIPRKPRAKVATCGTPGGISKHRRKGEKNCTLCAVSNKEYKRAWRARVRANNPKPPRAKKVTTLKPKKAPAPTRVKRAYSHDPECGTYAAYSRHKRYKETPCAPCRAANTAYYLAWYARRKKPAVIWTPAKCGTVRGYSSHYYFKVPMCPECKAAKSAYDKDRIAIKEAA
jgi:hypothetical protein